MIFQLRDYRIKAGEMDAWLEEWRSVVLPLRRRFGFEVVGAWVERDGDRFVWIIGHEDLPAQDESYYSSSERAAIDPDPARHIERTEKTLLVSVLG